MTRRGKFFVLSLLLLVFASDSFAVRWPFDGAGRKVAKIFGDFDGNKDWDYHEGVDFPATPNTAVKAIKAGVVVDTAPPPNGRVVVEVSATEYLRYLHLNTISVSVNDNVAEGAVLGTVGDYFTAYPDHLHLTTVPQQDFTPESAKNGLQLFSVDGDKDPRNQRPSLAERQNPTNPWDLDGDIFEFHPNGSTAKLPKKDWTWLLNRAVDAYIEIQDDMNEPTFLPAVYKSAYWVEQKVSCGGAHDVRTEASPYVLFEFDEAPTPVGIVSMIYPSDKTKNALGYDLNFHHAVTNTRDTDGALANVDDSQHWYTKADGPGTNGGNGVGANEATKAEDAYFPDGTYTFNAKIWDLIGERKGKIDVLVENFPPAVRFIMAYNYCEGVVIQFSEPMNRSSVEDAISWLYADTGAPVGYTTEWDASGCTITLWRWQPLDYAPYKVLVNADVARDISGGAGHNGAFLDSGFGAPAHNGLSQGHPTDSVWFHFECTGDPASSFLVARERSSPQPQMVEDSPGPPVSDLFCTAQAGTTWLGAVPPWGSTVGVGGTWDFDDGGTRSCPIENDHDEYLKNGAYAQGWTSEDVHAQKGLYWHAEDFTDPSFACSSNPIAGTYSAWCGSVTPDPGLCFTDAPGYGSNWSQWLCKPVRLDDATPSLRYSFRSDTEPGFDYCYVLVDSELPASCGAIGESATIIRCYDGPHDTTTTEDIDLSDLSADPEVCRVTISDYSGDSVKVCFVVVSNSTWDDQDGMYATCDGAFTVDDIFIDTAPSSGDSVITDFETGDLEGWARCGGWSAGDFAAIRDCYSFINNDICGFGSCTMADCVLTFYSPSIPGQYGNGGHYAGSFHKRAWSPAIDLTSYAHRGYVMSYDRYADLPTANRIFYMHYVRYMQNPNCPGAWSPPLSDEYVYHTSQPSCGQVMWDFSHLIPPDVDSVKVGLSVWNTCTVWGGWCTNGNESPIFDNVRVGIWNASAPRAAISPTGNYNDAFPEGDSLGTAPEYCDATALIDIANNLGKEGGFLRLGDTLVVSLDAPDTYAELCFKVVPGPCTNLTDSFFTTWFPSGNWSACNDDPSHNLFQCARMDTCFYAGNGIPGSPYEFQETSPGKYCSMIHEDDPRYLGEGIEIFPDSLFTPGTKIYYYIRTSYLPGPGPYSYLPPCADESDLSTMFEVEVLPDLCKDPPACLLYIDYYNRGAQPVVEEALALLGRTWDRFDLTAESGHQGNGIGNRQLGGGKYRLARGPIGPSLQHFAQYKVLLLNNGTLPVGANISDGGTALFDDPTDDVTFLSNWINEGSHRGLWLSGNNIAADFGMASSGPKPDFLNNTLGADLTASSYRDLAGHSLQGESCRELKTSDGYAARDNYYDTFDAIHLTGSGCPQRYDFDVVDVRPGGIGLRGYALLYDQTNQTFPPGFYASIDNIFVAGNVPFDTVRTKIDGFSLHLLRDYLGGCAGQTAVAFWIRDVLGGQSTNGYFYDRSLSFQYCPAVGPELVGVPGGEVRRYQYSLSQNYPNPFSGVSGTTIHYTAAKIGRVEIRIFDVAGRLLNTIVDEAELGDNFVDWDGRTGDGRRVSSGVYFYQMKAGKFTGHKKMLLVR